MPQTLAAQHLRHFILKILLREGLLVTLRNDVK